MIGAATACAGRLRGADGLGFGGGGHGWFLLKVCRWQGLSQVRLVRSRCSNSTVLVWLPSAIGGRQRSMGSAVASTVTGWTFDDPSGRRPRSPTAGYPWVGRCSHGWSRAVAAPELAGAVHQIRIVPDWASAGPPRTGRRIRRLPCPGASVPGPRPGRPQDLLGVALDLFGLAVDLRSLSPVSLPSSSSTVPLALLMVPLVCSSVMSIMPFIVVSSARRRSAGSVGRAR